MKLKTITLAALATLAVGQAFAGSGTTTANTTLVLLVGDEQHSYLYDTGISFANLAAGKVNTTLQLTNWSAFNFAATKPFDGIASGVRWALQGVAYNGTIATTQWLLGGTQTATTDGSFNTGVQNSAIKNDAAAAAFNDSANVQPLLASGKNVAANGDASGAFVTDAIFNYAYGGNLNSQAVATGNNVADIYQLLPTKNSRGLYANTGVVAFANTGEVATLNTTTGTLTIAAAAAVPEPSSYALLVAGLACVGFVARRRSV